MKKISIIHWLIILLVAISWQEVHAQKRFNPRKQKRNSQANKQTPVVKPTPPPPEKPVEKPQVMAGANKPVAPVIKGPSILFTEPRHNFGRIKQGETIKHNFTFTNNGSEELVITNVKPSCGCTATSWPKTPIKPGEKATIEAKFNTAGKMGNQKKSITVYTNMQQDNFKVIYLEGEVFTPTLPPPTSN